MKFFMILISLLMFCFGGIFMTVTNNPDEIIKRVRQKANYTTIFDKDMVKVNKSISKVRNISFIAFISGICLFTASLFL